VLGVVLGSRRHHDGGWSAQLVHRKHRRLEALGRRALAWREQLRARVAVGRALARILAPALEHHLAQAGHAHPRLLERLVRLEKLGLHDQQHQLGAPLARDLARVLLVRDDGVCTGARARQRRRGERGARAAARRPAGGVAAALCDAPPPLPPSPPPLPAPNSASSIAGTPSRAAKGREPLPRAMAAAADAAVRVARRRCRHLAPRALGGTR
jgi:hypothetical protein